ncbi:hypothetical protein AVEN_99136-1 [Araneus ventricosus]|uniref:Uncharacterized protein n=1 Tax=Araneus ventricosus TaxID=182803 RepID=A0A4Y2QQ04_ARAVE|nr:hypothetical protein AVEN_99136-1 [Araneus ventricosus]
MRSCAASGRVIRVCQENGQFRTGTPQVRPYMRVLSQPVSSKSCQGRKSNPVPDRDSTELKHCRRVLSRLRRWTLSSSLWERIWIHCQM